MPRPTDNNEQINRMQGRTKSRWSQTVWIDNDEGSPIPVIFPEGFESITEILPPNDFYITTMLVDDQPQKIPNTPNSDRLFVEVENLGADQGGTGETLFWGRDANITDVLDLNSLPTTNYGKRLRPNESSNFDLSGKDIWAKAPENKFVLIQVTEWIRVSP